MKNEKPIIMGAESIHFIRGRSPSPILRQFLRDLVWAADKTDKPDVRAFIKTWRKVRL